MEATYEISLPDGTIFVADIGSSIAEPEYPIISVFWKGEQQ